MKNISKIIALGVVVTLVVIGACKEPFDAEPIPASSASTYSANFIFANASDAVSLDLYVNNVKTPESTPAGAGQTAYTNIGIASNGISGAAGSNVNIRAKATTGTIGEVLGSNDMIFRSANNGTGNFTALDSAYYTVVALDTITRPAPLRKLNAGSFGDVTFFDPSSGTQLSVVDTVGKTPAFKAQLITIGIVPLGSSDPGGPRFIVITDQLPLPSTTRFPKPATGKTAVRVINGSYDIGAFTLKFGTTTISTGITTYPLLQSQFNPTVGSRSGLTAAFATINAANDLDFTLTSGATTVTLASQDLLDGGVYTVYISGSKKKGTLAISYIKNK